MKEEQLNTLCRSRIAPPANLLTRIMGRIDWERARATRRALAVWSFVAASAAAAMAGAGIFFVKEAIHSGLGEYVAQFWALVSTNPSLALAHWSEILTSIGESVPVVSLTVAAITIGIALWSADRVVNFSKRYKYKLA